MGIMTMAIITVGAASLQALGNMRARKAARSGAVHCTGAPVLRGSLEAGSFEEAFFAVPAKGETDRLLHVARRTLDAARRLRRDARAGLRTLSARERWIVRLSAGAVRIFEELLTLARLNRGRVYPSYDHLAEATGMGRATVARALTVLEGIGFLVRQRRFRRVGSEGGTARYAQTSNVYRALMPASVEAYLPRWMRPAPLPDDEAQHQAERAETMRDMLGTLSCRDLAEVTVSGPLGKVLARLGATLDRHGCESQKDPEPLSGSIYMNLTVSA